MNLPTPRLDDRTFQQLVDEAKRQVQQRCPGWTDHNVSDPGVTLIETFAWMTEMLLYRLNRVPDQMYVRFLEMMGVRLFPPQASRTEVSFRLSAHQPMTIRIAAGTAVSTRRTVDDRAVGFTTVRDLEIAPSVSRVIATMRTDGTWSDLTPSLGLGNAHDLFSSVPQVDDALYIGLDEPAPRSIVLIQFVCAVGGHGIDPRTPPLRWEAWTPRGWEVCDVQRDDTRGLNVSGGVELHLPATHSESVVSGISAGWLRCRVVSAPLMYRSSPEVASVSAATVGGDVEVVNAEPVIDELLGASDGTTGQRFYLTRSPVLPDLDTPLAIAVGVPRNTETQVAGGAVPSPGRPLESDLSWETWLVVDDFSGSGPTDRDFVLDRTSGEIRFGPAVREADGTLRRYGAVPPRGAVLRVGKYRTGGGTSGNIAPSAISVLRTSIPYVAAVYNRRPAAGGVNGETVDEARIRGPLEMRQQSRAVTAEDYVTLTKDAAPELARVHCIQVTDGPDAGGLRILVVPEAVSHDGRIVLGDLRPPQAAQDRVVRALDRARVLGARVSVEPPSYVGIRVDARVRARPGVDAAFLERDAVQALYEYYNPLTGGPAGDGWPLGRPVQSGEVYSVLSRVSGIDYVEDVALFRASPLDGSISAPQDRIDLAATHLVVSVEHSVYVEGR